MDQFGLFETSHRVCCCIEPNLQYVADRNAITNNGATEYRLWHCRHPDVDVRRRIHDFEGKAKTLEHIGGESFETDVGCYTACKPEA